MVIACVLSAAINYHRKPFVRVLTPTQPLASHLEAFALSLHHTKCAHTAAKPRTTLHRLNRFKFFIFLDSSALGPFVPHFVPDSWAWTRAFVEHLTPEGGLVSTAVHCTPEAALETWAWGASRGALAILMKLGVLGQTERAAATITRTVHDSGLPVTSLLYEHGPRQVGCRVIITFARHMRQRAWRDGQCGGAPREGLNPYETVFVQADRGGVLARWYSRWRLAEADGAFNTEGQEDQLMYKFAIQCVLG